MNTREQLLAYLEGTLTPEHRLRVARRLQDSPRWQRELADIQQMQRQLRLEMPLFGQSTPPNLDTLLPSILEQTTTPRFRWDILRTGVVVCGVMALLVLIPLFLHSTSVDAVTNWSHNVPQNTATQSSQLEELRLGRVIVTDEPDYSHLLLDVGDEPDLLSDLSIKRGAVVTISWSASPVPMPGATLLPSLQAVSKK